MKRNAVVFIYLFFEVIFFGVFFGHVWGNLGKNPSHPQKVASYTYASFISTADKVVTNGRGTGQPSPTKLTLKDFQGYCCRNFLTTKWFQ